MEATPGTRIEGKVVEICRLVLKDSSITIESTSTSVEGWDSLSHMDLIAAIEANFGIELDVMDMADVDSVGALVEVVARAVNSPHEEMPIRSSS